MRLLPTTTASVLACLVILGCASSPELTTSVPSAPPEAVPLLEALQQMAERGETPDFWALREGFSRSDLYSPYGREFDDLAEKAFEHLKEGDASGAREVSERMLELSPLHPKAHVVASRAAEELGDQAAADFHDWVLSGLFDSICGERSGLDPEDPCPVLATYEEYFFLYSYGFRVVEQNLTKCAGRPCDLMEVENPETGERYTFFFDISLPMDYLNRKLEAED